MIMPPQTVRAILDAIRLLSDAQRRSLIEELTHENFTEPPEDIVAMKNLATKPRELRPEELQANPLLLDLLERARAGGELVVTYQGMTIVLQAVEDITHTFSPEELERFTSDYTAAEDPANRFTAEEALERFRKRSPRQA